MAIILFKKITPRVAGFSFPKVIVHTRPLKMVLPWIVSMEKEIKYQQVYFVGREDGWVIYLKSALFKTLQALAFVCLLSLWLPINIAKADNNAEITTKQYVINLPSQSVADSLNDLAKQTGAQFLFSYDLAENKTAKSVRGSFTLSDALEQMLEGTGLKSGFDNGFLSIFSLQNTMEPNDQNINGREEVNVKRNMITSVLAFLLGSGIAQSQDTNVNKADESEIDTVITIGTRGKPRSVLKSAVPADVFSADDLERRANDGLIDALNFLTPSYNAPTRAGGGTASIIATGALRGLNPDHTLILVNGKRRHKSSLIMAVSSLYNGSAPVDLDMIPLSAIKTVEVLRDGAAAQYGSDAIAGVINIILKDSDEGGSASTTYSENFDNGDG